MPDNGEVLRLRRKTKSSISLLQEARNSNIGTTCGAKAFDEDGCLMLLQCFDCDDLGLALIVVTQLLMMFAPTAACDEIALKNRKKHVSTSVRKHCQSYL